MFATKKLQYFHHGERSFRCNNNDATEDNLNQSVEQSIPPRYRSEQGGVNTDQVRKDRDLARQKVIRAWLRYIKALFL